MIGSTCETVVSGPEAGPTRFPIWASAIPAIPSTGGDAGEPQVELRLLQGRLGGAARLHGVVVALPRRGLGRVQLGLPLQVELGLVEIGPDPVAGRLEGARVDLEQKLALSDRRPVGVGLAQHVAGDLGPDLGVDEAVRRPDPLLQDPLVALDDAGDQDLGRRGYCLGLAAAAGGEGGRGGGEERQGPGKASYWGH